MSPQILSTNTLKSKIQKIFGGTKMARINIDDSIHTDKRFMDLSLKLGSRERAMGELVYAWILAQRYWKTNVRLIPLNEWKRNLTKPDELLEFGFAELIDDLVYVCGSERQFAWLLQKQQAGRGNKGKFKKRTFDSVQSRLTRDEPPTPSPSHKKEEIRKQVSVEAKQVRISGHFVNAPIWFLKAINEETETKLINLYGDAQWIENEIAKADTWLSINSNKSPKSDRGFARFIYTWLKRGWETHRTKLPSSKNKTINTVPLDLDSI